MSTNHQRPSPPAGSLCQLLGDYLVRHVAPCDEYPHGTVVNCVTGEVQRVQN